MTLSTKFFCMIMSAGALSAVLPDNNPEASNSYAIFTEPQNLTKTDSSRIQEIDEMLTKAFTRGGFNGSVLYAESGKILYSQHFGYANLKTKEELNDESVFQMASTSKPFTAVAIMQLQEKGKINIDDLVVDYLPDFPYKNVTVKQLLQHRSGLPNYIYYADKYWNKVKPLTNDDVTVLLKKHNARLEYTPGARFKYCNTNYAYLALLVEKISKEDFADYMDEHIFKPAGMQHTFVYDHFAKNNQHAVKGYSKARKGYYERPCDHLDGVVGDKDLYSTVQDMFLFDQALRQNKLLSAESHKLMLTPAIPFDAKHTRDYGLGFRIKMEDGSVMAYHNGWWKGFRTYFIHDTERDRTLIWLNNRSDVHITAYMNQILSGSSDEEETTVENVNINENFGDQKQ